jgi:hypothetical protein
VEQHSCDLSSSRNSAEAEELDEVLRPGNGRLPMILGALYSAVVWKSCNILLGWTCEESCGEVPDNNILHQSSKPISTSLKRSPVNILSLFPHNMIKIFKGI